VKNLINKWAAMIGYVTLGTNDIKRAAAFYDALLQTVGAKRLVEMETCALPGRIP
jgi:hypothetical protein